MWGNPPPHPQAGCPVSASLFRRDLSADGQLASTCVSPALCLEHGRPAPSYLPSQDPASPFGTAQLCAECQPMPVFQRMCCICTTSEDLGPVSREIMGEIIPLPGLNTCTAPTLSLSPGYPGALHKGRGCHRDSPRQGGPCKPGRTQASPLLPTTPRPTLVLPLPTLHLPGPELPLGDMT